MSAKRQVIIIGAGPAGLMLAHILSLRNIDCVVIERQSRDYCEQRIRAGVLEQGTVDLLRKTGVHQRLDSEGLVHEGIQMGIAGNHHIVEFEKYFPDKKVTVYGQTQIVCDLFAVLEKNNIDVICEAEATEINDIESDSPSLNYLKDGKTQTITADFIVACDGYWGIGLKHIPENKITIYSQDYPYSWLGILADAPPLFHLVVYAYHRQGFALQSMRGTDISRSYIQVDVDDDVKNWSDDAIWDALDIRMGKKQNRGKITQKSITPMRSFMVDNMQHNRLFIAGDAAHIVPPTGAKGLNSAIADIALLSAGLIDFYTKDDEHYLKNYSQLALERTWKVQNFSYSTTRMLHYNKSNSAYEHKVQEAGLQHFITSDTTQHAFSENYVGLPIAKLPET